MDWEGSEKVNVNVLKDNFVCRMSFLHNDFYRPTTWQGRHFLSALGIDHHHSQNPSLSNFMTIHQVTILTSSLDKACTSPWPSDLQCEFTHGIFKLLQVTKLISLCY